MLIEFTRPIILAAAAAVGGAMEAQGPLGAYLDLAFSDERFGAKSWESAEASMLAYTIERALHKSELRTTDIDLIFSGDLLNQCTASSFGTLPYGIPYLGLYNACATFAAACMLSGIALEAGAAKRTLACASSHFSSAERQYRFPLEYGCQRTPTSQHTVTAAGCALFRLKSEADAQTLRLTRAFPGTIVDFGIRDAANMGAAMAPAAAKTLLDFFAAVPERPQNYDLILTGDLGAIGAKHFTEICSSNGLDLQDNYCDCGTQIYHDDQDVHAGASGCGCSAFYLCGYLEKVWRTSKLDRILLLGTGALMSPLTVQQKESIPAIAHLIELRKE